MKLYKVAVLSTKDEEQWLEILNRLDLKDPHYLPSYLELFEKESNRDSFMNYGGQGLLFVYGDSRNFIIYPFFKRCITYLQVSGNSVNGLYDIVSPYGYGGPLAQIKDETITEELWRGFFNRFDDFCRQSRIASGFCRLHPIFENHETVRNFSQGVTQQLGQIVYLDLSHSEEEIFAEMEKPHRRRIRRALETPGLSFCLDQQDYHCQYFFERYTETMLRLKAHKKYFFSLDFFKAAFRTLGEHLRFQYITYLDEIVSGLLTLTYGDIVYSWLSWSEPEYFHFHPTNFLIYRSILQSKKEGLKYFVLGGGVANKQDSLFAFKSGFSKLRKDFYIYKRIYLEKEYKQLVELQGHRGEETRDFFPQYRLGDLVSEAMLSTPSNGRRE